MKLIKKLLLEKSDLLNKENYIIQVELPNGVKVGILIPREHPYSTDEQPFDMNGMTFGLNFVTDGHYC